MNKATSLIYGLAVGAGMMYFMDPRRGVRRRAMVKDQAMRWLHDTDILVDKGVQDMRNRARGVSAELHSRIAGEEDSDWLIQERVRAEMGRHIRYARAIQVTAADGQVSVSGPVLQQDATYLLTKIGAVRGVKGVEEHLEVHTTAENVPALQAAEIARQEMESGTSWSPTARMLAGVGGIAMLAFGTIRGGLVGSSMSVAGIGLAARGISNKNIGDLVGMNKMAGAVDLQKSIHINAPVHTVYEMWTRFKDFPQFMDHLKSVKMTGVDRSHWVAKGPADSSVEWDAVTTQNIPDRLISWESTPDSTVTTRGSVRFHDNGNGTCEVTVRMAYTPPAGAIGHAVAAIFGDDPKTVMDEDLMRMKSLVEAGKTTSGGQTVTREEMG